jgi:flagellar protein FliL
MVKMAEEKKESALAPAKEAPPTTGGKNPLLMIALLVNTLLMGTVAFFQYRSFQSQSKHTTIQDVMMADMTGDKQGEAKAEVGKSGAPGEGGKAVAVANNLDIDGKLFPLQTFSANLAQGDGPRRYIRLDAVLKFSMDAKEDEFNARKPQIRDKIISILNSKRPEELLKAEGKTYLKEEIKSAVNSFLINGRVIDVFYVGFQIN